MIKKILLGVVVVLGILIVGALVYGAATRDATNARVAEEIRQNPEGARAAKAMLLTLADGTMYPVNFLYEDDKVFMGIDGLWWREFVAEPKPVSMFIKGETFSGKALVELEDQAYINDIFSRLRPTVPKWLPDALNGKLVVISLDEESKQRAREYLGVDSSSGV